MTRNGAVKSKLAAWSSCLAMSGSYSYWLRPSMFGSKPAGAVEDAVQHRAAVDGVVDRLAHPRVGDGGVVDAELEVLGTDAGHEHALHARDLVDARLLRDVG